MWFHIRPIESIIYAIIVSVIFPASLYIWVNWYRHSRDDVRLVLRYIVSIILTMITTLSITRLCMSDSSEYSQSLCIAYLDNPSINCRPYFATNLMPIAYDTLHGPTFLQWIGIDLSFWHIIKSILFSFLVIMSLYFGVLCESVSSWALDRNIQRQVSSSNHISDDVYTNQSSSSSVPASSSSACSFPVLSTHTLHEIVFYEATLVYKSFSSDPYHYINEYMTQTKSYIVDNCKQIYDIACNTIQPSTPVPSPSSPPLLNSFTSSMRSYLIVPICEELLYRSLLYAIIGGAVPGYRSNSFIVLISALLFASAHIHHIFKMIWADIDALKAYKQMQQSHQSYHNHTPSSSSSPSSSSFSFSTLFSIKSYPTLQMCLSLPNIRSYVLQICIQFTYTFLFSLFTGYIYIITHSLYAIILSHILCNYIGLPQLLFNDYYSSLFQFRKRFIFLYIFGIISCVTLLYCNL